MSLQDFQERAYARVRGDARLGFGLPGCRVRFLFLHQASHPGRLGKGYDAQTRFPAKICSKRPM